MINTAAISFLFAATAAPVASDVHSAVTVFRDACLQGEVRLPATEARPIARKDVPSAVLRPVSRFPWHLTDNTQYYELRLPEGQAFLIVQPSVGRPGGGRYCSVASKRINYWDARVATNQHPGMLDQISASERKQMERMGYSHTTSTFGFEIDLRRVDNGYVLMTSFLPDRRTAN